MVLLWLMMLDNLQPPRIMGFMVISVTCQLLFLTTGYCFTAVERDVYAEQTIYHNSSLENARYIQILIVIQIWFGSNLFLPISNKDCV